MQLILLAAILVPAIFFLLTEANTLKLISPENRLMRPGQVWLQLIPLFGQIWQFVVVTRIAGSIQKQWQAGDEDSILGISAEAAADTGKRKPTMGIGMAYCQLSVGSILCNYIFKAREDYRLGAIVGLIGLASMICWIVYWVQLAGWKRRLKSKVALAAA